MFGFWYTVVADERHQSPEISEQEAQDRRTEAQQAFAKTFPDSVVADQLLKQETEYQADLRKYDERGYSEYEESDGHSLAGKQQVATHPPEGSSNEKEEWLKKVEQDKLDEAERLAWIAGTNPANDKHHPIDPVSAHGNGSLDGFPGFDAVIKAAATNKISKTDYLQRQAQKVLEARHVPLPVSANSSTSRMQVDSQSNHLEKPDESINSQTDHQKPIEIDGTSSVSLTPRVSNLNLAKESDLRVQSIPSWYNKTLHKDRQPDNHALGGIPPSIDLTLDETRTVSQRVETTQQGPSNESRPIKQLRKLGSAPTTGIEGVKFFSSSRDRTVLGVRTAGINSKLAF